MRRCYELHALFVHCPILHRFLSMGCICIVEMMMNTLSLIMAETLLASASDTARAMMVKSYVPPVLTVPGIFRSVSRQGI